MLTDRHIFEEERNKFLPHIFIARASQMKGPAILVGTD